MSEHNPPRGRIEHWIWNRVSAGCWVLGLALGASLFASADEVASPLSPADELATMRLADERLVMELVVAEPDVVDPVACAWDAWGRLYVVEMRDYPTGPRGGTIKRLVDRDGDGCYEDVKVFADEFNFPTSVLPWRDGVLVSAAPEVLFLQDTDGDGRADQRRVLLTGFAEGNQQLRVNGLTWGLDGWIYGANGRSDGQIRRVGDDPKEAVSLRRHDFRFRPDTGEFETTTGPSQFGLARDDWGNRFLSWNINPLRHVVIEESYLARNPSLAAGGTEDLIDFATEGRVYPVSRPPRTFNRESVRHFNASCGITIYRGDILPDEYQGNALVCEPLTNLVHRRVLKPRGATFEARRHEREQEREFLASTDPWFRPVNLTTGPDGALYVVDFYRKWVEHPDFIPEPLREGVDFRTGASHGRIWRIRQRGAAPRTLPAPPASLTTAELVELLDHAGGWWRDTAQRLIVERGEREAPSLLGAYWPHARTEAGGVLVLWTLHVLGALDDPLLEEALGSRWPRVREQALKLCEGRSGGSAKLFDKMVVHSNDPDERVRFQLALSLGSLPDKRKIDPLIQLGGQGALDRWQRLAIVAGLQGLEMEALERVLQSPPDWLTTPAGAALLVGLAEAIGVRNEDRETEACARLATIGEGVPALAIWSGLSQGLQRAGVMLGDALGSNTSISLKRAVATAGLFAERDQPEAHRLLAVVVLSAAGTTEADRAIIQLLTGQESRAVEIAAVQAVGRRKDATLAQAALGRWDALSMPVRRELISACCQNAVLAATLLRAIENEQLAPTDLDFAQRDALIRAIGEPGQSRVRAILGDLNTNRAELVARYDDALKLTGDRRRGAGHFAQHCAVCHLVQGYGAGVGPDLTGIGSRAPAVLLVDILDPGREVPTDFLSYVVETTDGQILAGLIAAESSSAIMLRGPEGTETVLPRGRVARIQSTGKSLMPEGLEQKLSLQDIADLLAFLAQPERRLLPAKP